MPVIIDFGWQTYFEGSGSVTGNAWLEQVCYLGKEQWLVGLSDDIAWSADGVEVNEPEPMTS